MSDRSDLCVVFCVLLAGFCFISWKHSLIGVKDALKLAGRGFIFLGIFTWLIYMFQRLKYFFFPAPCMNPTDRNEQIRRIQQHQHNDKTSDYAESVIKWRQNLLLQQKMERWHRMTGETWKLSKGFPVRGEEDQMCHDPDVDKNPNQGAKRRRKLLQTVTQDPVQQEVSKQKRIIVLPDEPSADTEGVVKIALGSPSGRTIYRRLLKIWSSLEEKMTTPLSPDYVPSIFAHISAEQRQKNLYAKHRFEHTQQMKRKRTETLPETDRETVVASSIINATEDDTMEVQAECMHDEGNYSQAIHSPDIVGPCSNAASQATVEALKNECKRLRAEVHRLKDKVDELSLNEEAFKGNDDMVQELTGLPSYAK